MFPTSMDLHISEGLTTANSLRSRAELKPIKYGSMRWFYILNYAILMCLIALPILIGAMIWQ